MEHSERMQAMRRGIGAAVIHDDDLVSQTACAQYLVNRFRVVAMQPSSLRAGITNDNFITYLYRSFQLWLHLKRLRLPVKYSEG